MTDREAIKLRIYSIIQALSERNDVPVEDATTLLGDGSILDSMKLVELCLSLEDFASELGFEFSWTSEVAMSRSRSMFRNAGALAAEFLGQMEAQA